jgi:hypothetical protein
MGETMKLLQPKFKELQQGNGGGMPVLKTLWDKFDFSLLLTQSGIIKYSGIQSWIIVFAYIAGLIANKKSVSEIAEYAANDKLLQPMFRNLKIAQCTLSRFFTTNYNWLLFGLKRVERLQHEQETALSEGDVIDLDDTKVAHPHGKKIPFLCWLFDSSDKIDVYCMNIVATIAVLKNGLKLPLFWRIWRKEDNIDDRQSKLELSKQMLLDIRKLCTHKLWVAMDRWFLCKDFFNWLIQNNYDWVTKAKRNTSLFRKETENATGRERFVPVKPSMLIKEVFLKLIKNGERNELSAVSIPDIFIKMPQKIVSKRGKETIKNIFVPIAAIAAVRLHEDSEKIEDKLDNNNDDVAIYRGAYLLISNRVDAPKEVLDAYIKRWCIEVFFRTAKQELGLNCCHSTSQSHHYAHIELLFTAETLLAYARWELNNDGVEEDFTHGQMVRYFFNAAYSIVSKVYHYSQKIQVYFATDVGKFARLIEKFWPDNILLTWFSFHDIHLLELTA